MSRTKVAIIGSGAIGGVFATKLKKAGAEVSFFSKKKTKIIESIILSKCELFYEAIPNDRYLDPGPSSYDIIVIAVKIYDLQKTILEYKDLLDNARAIVSIQSYINFTSLNWFGNEYKIIPAAVMFGAYGKPSSLITYFADGFMYVGSYSPNDYFYTTLNLLNNVSTTVVSDDISFHLFLKVLINASITPFTLKDNCCFGLSFETGNRKEFASQIFFEGIRLAKIIFPEKKYIVFENYNLNNINSLSDSLKVIRFILTKYYYVIPSIVFDVIRNKQTELPYIYNDILELAKKYNFPTPHLSSGREISLKYIADSKI